ncbi:hypothetical protein SDC9_162064 [bioreactor metagenome]|uniref:Uncharacterized protein n=1 Tax=bioreactor metagenome TaxID=1076179 RepID=A0A645FK03_9ZZZZ
MRGHADIRHRYSRFLREGWRLAYGRLVHPKPPLQHLIGSGVPDHLHGDVAPVAQRAHQIAYGADRQPEQLRQIIVCRPAVPRRVRHCRNLGVQQLGVGPQLPVIPHSGGQHRPIGRLLRVVSHVITPACNLAPVMIQWACSRWTSSMLPLQVLPHLQGALFCARQP